MPPNLSGALPSIPASQSLWKSPKDEQTGPEKCSLSFKVTQQPVEEPGQGASYWASWFLFCFTGSVLFLVR